MKKTRILGIVVISIIAILVVGELAIRIFYPQQLIQLKLDAWEEDAKYGFRLGANYDTEINLGDGTVQLITDQYGRRVGSTPRDESDAAYRILVVGDSFVEGTAVEYEDTATALLETRLTEALGAPVSVTNAGTWGYRPEQYLLREEEELDREDYELVLIFLYTGNDIDGERLTDFSSTVPTYPHPLRVPRNLSSDELIDAIFYPINDIFEARSQLYLLLKAQLEPLRAALGLSSSEIPSILLKPAASSPRWEVAGDIAGEMAQVAEAHDTSVMFVIIPTQFEVDEAYLDLYAEASEIDPATIDPDQPSRLLIQELEGRELAVIDTRNALEAAIDNGAKNVYVNYVHFGLDGHEAVTEALFPVVLERLQQISNN